MLLQLGPLKGGCFRMENQRWAETRLNGGWGCAGQNSLRIVGRETRPHTHVHTQLAAAVSYFAHSPHCILVPLPGGERHHADPPGVPGYPWYHEGPPGRGRVPIPHRCHCVAGPHLRRPCGPSVQCGYVWRGRCLLFVCGVFVACVWSICSLRVCVARAVLAVCVACLWRVCGEGVACCLLCGCGVCVACVWRVCGVCVACVWRVCGESVACVWRVCGVFVACVW